MQSLLTQIITEVNKLLKTFYNKVVMIWNILRDYRKCLTLIINTYFHILQRLQEGMQNVMIILYVLKTKGNYEKPMKSDALP